MRDKEFAVHPGIIHMTRRQIDVSIADYIIMFALFGEVLFG